MCGVCASTDRSPASAQAAVARINALQTHRGPDGAVTVLSGGTCLGNTRLAIVSPGSAGDQPLDEPSGACTAVFNGEVYNHRELRSQYGLRGSGSDGSVIPELYARFGESAFRLLRGMFSIILLDHRTGRLVLARDRFGIKPLHYRLDAGALVAASDLRPLVRPDDRVAAAAIARFLHLGALGPDQSPFEEICSVPPNTWVAFRGVTRVGSGAVDPGLDVTSRSETPVADALRESVRLHLRSDVPTALLLSSGLDSSAIAWAASEAGHQLHSLTVELGGGRAEADEAARTAAIYGHTHEVVAAAPHEGDLLPFFEAMQRPSVDGLNSFLVCRAVKAAGFKVAVSGLGGDEVTGGYAHFGYLGHLRRLAAAHRTPAISSAVDRITLTGRHRQSKAQEFLSSRGPRDARQLSLLQRRLWPVGRTRAALGLSHTTPLIAQVGAGSGGWGAAALSAAELDLYLQSTLLPDADAFSMASSVELRVPFVDPHVVTAAVTAGGSRGLGKRGFAEALGEPRLRALAAQPKQGFSLPMDEWLRVGLLRPLVEQTFTEDALVWDHVDRAVGGLVLEEWRQRRIPWSHVWALVVLHRWLASLA